MAETMTTERRFLLAYDMELCRPGCVLVAAALGADSDASSRFDTRTWLLAPTPTMRVYRITESQLVDAVRRTEELYNDAEPRRAGGDER